jgi:hypothetical protein
MTRPVMVGFLHEGEQPKVFFRAMLYATGKRGHILETLSLKVRRGDTVQRFDFWMYGETKDLKIGSGLRAGEDGVAFNHHFLPPKDAAAFEFLAGEYVIDIHARVVNRAKPMLLSSVRLSVSQEQAATLGDTARGVLFTWEPEAQNYRGELSEPTPTEGRSRSVSGAGRGKLPWA